MCGWRQSLRAAGIHQLLTHSIGYAPSDAPRAVIIHPQPGGHAHGSLQVDGPLGGLGIIDVLGIETHALPEEATTWIRSVLLRVPTTERIES